MNSFLIFQLETVCEFRKNHCLIHWRVYDFFLMNCCFMQKKLSRMNKNILLYPSAFYLTNFPLLRVFVPTQLSSVLFPLLTLLNFYNMYHNCLKLAYTCLCAI